MTNTVFAERSDVVKEQLVADFSAHLDTLLGGLQEDVSARGVEVRIWCILLDIGRLLLSCCLAMQCRKATEEDIRKRGLSEKQVIYRNDQDYWASTTTTLGSVHFPLFAYRERCSPFSTVTRVPTRDRVLPLQRHCHSSELCIEWETRLGSQHPFRLAQEELRYFTHGAVTLEDTTIAHHMVCVGKIVDREWLYRPVDQFRAILETRATLDRETGKPIVYLSTDAHALRRYVDETWEGQWKMANGLRIWCVDRHHGGIIHLGGEYTWGNCEEVERIVQCLRDSGRLPADGDYGAGLVARIAIVTDGAPWIEERLVPLFPGAMVILDAYHAMEHVATYTAARFGKGSTKAKDLYRRAVEFLLGPAGEAKGPAKPRKGHKKRPAHHAKAQAVSSPLPSEVGPAPEPSTTVLGLIQMLEAEPAEPLPEPPEPLSESQREAHQALVGYLKHNSYRMNYVRYRQLGYQIGSGAMESLHRTASQVRLKIPGARWLLETSQAIFNLRMLDMVGNWEAFWHQPDITSKLATALTRPQPVPASSAVTVSPKPSAPSPRPSPAAPRKKRVPPNQAHARNHGPAANQREAAV